MRDARKVGLVLTAMALACGMQVIGARADGPHGGGGSGSGGTGGATAPASPCAAPGITEVPMLGDTVSLGLPLSVDTTTTPPMPSLAGNVVVCTDIPDGSGSGSFADEAVVVPGAGEAGFGSATCAPQGAAFVGPTCAALIAVQPPTAGASGLTLHVSLPMAMCVTSPCSASASTPNVATAVVTGMLQCTYPSGTSSSTGPAGGAICTWQGADLTVNGVPLPTPSNLSSGGLTAGGWVAPHVNVDIGFLAVLTDCATESSDPSTCAPQPDDMWVTAHAGGGRVLLLVVPDYHIAVAMPVAVASCTQLHGAGHC